MLQDDGFEAIYYHLKKDSIVVNVGQKVEAGQTLAQIGCNNGCVNGSHLHLQVGGLTDDGIKTVPINFYTTNPNESWAPVLNQVVETFATIPGNQAK